MVDKAFLHFSSDLTTSWDLFLKQENVVYNCAKSYIIFKSAYGRQVPVPFYLFLSGDGGC